MKQNQYAVPVEVICEMDDTPKNRAIMERYKTLVTIHYNEPGQDGQFDDCTKCIGGTVRRWITQMPKKNLRRISTLINI